MTEFIYRLTTGLVLIGVVCLVSCLPVYIFSLAAFLLLCYLIWYEWPSLSGNSLFLKILTPFYLGVPIAALVRLYATGYKKLLFLLYLCIGSFDTGSYCFGKLFGKHPILLWVSPGKTWEGVLGGFMTMGAIVALFVRYQEKSFVGMHVFVVSLSSILALTGDLFESWLKRRAGLKDSGTCLPGHGGILDRIDSLLFTLPSFYYLREELCALFF